MEISGPSLVTELQDEILALAGYSDAVRWRTVSKRWNIVINKNLNSGKMKMCLQDRLTIALAKLKQNNFALTEQQINMLRKVYDLDGVRKFIAEDNGLDIMPMARAITFVWLFVGDEFELFKSCVNEIKQLRPNRYTWFQIYAPELHFIATYLSLCRAPEFDELGLANAERVDQFLKAINNEAPSLDETMRHEDEYLALLEDLFAHIKVLIDNKISPDMLTALQVLKSDLQPIANNADRTAENLFVAICYFLNKLGLNVPQGSAKLFLRSNLSTIAAQIVSKQVIDNTDFKVVDIFHSRVIAMFDTCLKGVPPPVYRLKDPMMPISPAIFVACVNELLDLAQKRDTHRELLELLAAQRLQLNNDADVAQEAEEMLETIRDLVDNQKKNDPKN